MLTPRTRLAVGILVASCSGLAHAQPAIPWATIDCGGGRSSGGGFTVTGTIGQWDAGASQSATFISAGGFWSAATFPGSCAGDLDFDNDVDDFDFVLFAQQYDVFDCTAPVMPGACRADLNGDAQVDDTDFVLFAFAYDQFICP